MEQQSKKIAIIIVNWNGKKLLKNCLDSVFNQTYLNFDVYFVDNGSNDGSSDYVLENYLNAKIIQLEKNTGFARGNNIGIKKALEDDKVEYIVTINNDTKAEIDFLEKLVVSAESNKEIGSVAPKMKFFYEPELIDSVGVLIHKDGGGLSRGNRELDEGQFDQQEEIFGACGGAALYKKAMLKDIEYGDNEYFDNDFFAYYEDLDLAWRARLREWKTITCPEAVIHHIHSATAVSYSSFKAFHVNRNRFFVIIKSYPFWMMIKALFILTPIRYLHLFNSIRTKKGPSHKLKSNTSGLEPIKIVLRGWLSVIYFMPKMIIKRWQIQRARKVNNLQVKKWFEDYSAKMEDMIYK